MATHTAVVTVSVRGALETRQVRTIPPSDGEVRVRVEWTASTPVDLHQNDGGLFVTHPQVLGDGTAGTVVEVGPGVKKLKVGDRVSSFHSLGLNRYFPILETQSNSYTKVFGFTWRTQQEKSHQEFVTVPEFLLGIVSSNPSSSPYHIL